MRYCRRLIRPGRCAQRPGFFLLALFLVAMNGQAQQSVLPLSIAPKSIELQSAEPAVADASTALSNPYPKVAKAYYVELNGQALWGQAIDEPLPPASLTKLMTAHLVMQAGQLQQEVIVSAAAAAMPGSRLGLRKGDRISRADLLKAMLLGSGNDACVALAESLHGSEQAFVDQMNAEAARLHLPQTRFVNACGFDADEHRSSIRDLVRLTALAMQHETIATTVALTEGSVQINGKKKTIKTSNALIGRLPGAIGVKTGFTNQAGKCVIALTERDGNRVLAVFLNAPDRWWNLAAIIELAFRESKRRPAR